MKITLKCEREIAYDSPDHLAPLGTMQDNSTNARFNKKFYGLHQNNKTTLKVLDLGCSGGGFIRNCINDGCLGVGLEGSDHSKKFKRAGWAIIPEFLFTCDISKDFQLSLDDKEMNFNLITSWEVLEHLKEEAIDTLIENVKKHLSEDGLFISSISDCKSPCGDLELHQTQQPKEWWINKFKEHGLYERKELYKYFNKQYVRGRKEKSWNFHTILSLRDKEFDFKLTFKDKLKDFWVGSRSQIILSYIVNGKVSGGY